MTPLEQYYIRQAGGGRGSDSGIGPIYSVPPFIQRGHGIGSFPRGLWRTVQPVLWSSAKSLGRKALRTGGKIMIEIADNPSQTGHILSQHATETTENIIKSYVVVVREQLPAKSILKLKELKSQSQNRHRRRRRLLKNARPPRL